MLLKYHGVVDNINHVNNNGKSALNITTDACFDIATAELKAYGAIVMK